MNTFRVIEFPDVNNESPSRGQLPRHFMDQRVPVPVRINWLAIIGAALAALIVIGIFAALVASA